MFQGLSLLLFPSTSQKSRSFRDQNFDSRKSFSYIFDINRAIINKYNRSLKKYMLRKTGRKRARVPLTREGLTLRWLHADGCTGLDEERPEMFPTIVGYRGFQRRCCLQASRISPAFGRVFLPCHTIGAGCGLTSYLSPKGETKKSPPDSSSNRGGFRSEAHMSV